jgi:magnesium transporter
LEVNILENGGEFSQNLAIREKKGFCVVLVGGQTRRKESDNVEDFRDLIAGASVAWVDYVVNDFDSEVFEISRALGFSDALTRNLLSSSPKSNYEDFDTEMGMILPAIFLRGFDVKLLSLLILIHENLIVTLHTTEVTRFLRARRYATTFLRKIPQNILLQDKITLLLIRIVDENNSRNFDHLREIEEHGDKLSEELANPKTPRDLMGQKIYQMKHALIVYLRGLWMTVDTLNSLRYGDAELLTDDPKILDNINALIGEVNLQIGLAEHMSEVLASGLEVLQSIYNNQLQVLNNRLALLVGYLTIIGTALLVPNTIATVAGNTMFQFTPADQGWYLTVIIGSTVFATILSWWIVKKKGLLPRTYE